MQVGSDIHRIYDKWALSGAWPRLLPFPVEEADLEAAQMGTHLMEDTTWIGVSNN
jgi:hypothetical protein